VKVGDLLVMRGSVREGTSFPGEVTGIIIDVVERGRYRDFSVLWMDGKIDRDLVDEYLVLYYEICERGVVA